MSIKNKILLSVLASVGIYLAWMAITDWQSVVDSIMSISIPGLIVVLTLSLINYVLRFVRWAHYLRSFGYAVPTLHNFNCYIAGFAFTTTPGKAGEALRSVFLQKHGVRIWHSVACVVTERIIDLITVVMLAALGLVLFPQWAWLAGAALLACIALIAVVRSGMLNAWWARMQQHIAGTATGARLGTLTEKWQQIRHLWHPRILLTGISLGLVAWAAEAIGLVIIVSELGYETSSIAIVAIYSLSMLAGALSMMPGGLGGAEATMTFLLTATGMGLPEAVSATLICRAATLWFAVGLGAVALVPAAAVPGLSMSRS